MTARQGFALEGVTHGAGSLPHFLLRLVTSMLPEFLPHYTMWSSPSGKEGEGLTHDSPQLGQPSVTSMSPVMTWPHKANAEYFGLDSEPSS